MYVNLNYSINSSCFPVKTLWTLEQNSVELYNGEDVTRVPRKETESNQQEPK